MNINFFENLWYGNTEFDFCTIAHVKVELMVGNYVSVRGSRFGEIIW